jgi:peptidyl-tRNA hydrolase
MTVKKAVVLIRKDLSMGKVFLLLAACVGLVGCSTSASFTNPVDGKIATCTGGFLSDINIWGNDPLCLEQYVSAGYQRVR